MSHRSAVAVLGLVVALASCSSGDPVERLAAQLNDGARREQAIDGLLVLVRQAPESKRAEVKKRVVHTLMEAYRQDTARPQIIAALALLKDPRAEEVFVAALKDADRGGAYFEAAVRSARLIGELDLKGQAPMLATTLEQSLKAPRQDRNTWLERSLIQAIERLGDRRAAPVLIRALRADPARLDFYVSRLAARALGHLRDPSAVDPLVASLGATGHGLLLFEESRRALCRIGRPALDKLLAAAGARRDRRPHHPAANATAAIRVLGDLGDQRATQRLAELVRPGDPDQHRLVVAETMLRRGRAGGRAAGPPRAGAERPTTLHAKGQLLLTGVLGDKKASVTARRRAAELWGWYGGKDRLDAQLRTSCKGSGPEAQLLCWSVALAHSRASGSAGLEPLDKLRASMQDMDSQRHLQVYRARLALVQTCGEQTQCYETQLATAKDWRVRERAALELGRVGASGAAPALARRLAGAHPQVTRAILVGLERLTPRPGEAAQVSAAVQEMLAPKGKQAEPHGATPPELISRAVCLGERLERTNREKR